MTVRQRIQELIIQSTGPICDDCLAAAAGLSRRQGAYQECRRSADEGTIVRGYGRCVQCRKSKTVNRTLAMPALKPVVEARPLTGAANAPPDWYWEGNVQAALVSWLAKRGYLIRSVADTASRAQGKDVVALNPDGRELWVSVKGYPESSPHTQARHWFSGAVLDLVLYRSENPEAHLALCLPDGFATYAGLATRVAWLRQAMPFSIYWVGHSGEVRVE